MDGYVIFMNDKAKKAIIRTKSGKYTVLQLLDRLLFKVGDLISGKLDKMGQTKVVNLTQRRLVPAYVTLAQNTVAQKAKEQARRI